ncbi:fructose-1,6-bisphosphatase [Moesziomyces antarcticus]|uniref:Fructose-1,6-bisphosphatase n=1 Tax=Pseudozyma antarctica TaxID=84753 RepID=A0A081CCJ0_PSEA2|nr:fructose-1,6-bisphosphatase [Moesziomyces antarcticus]GAK64386.1 fructose-1,6-bisphosphatase [Moesziomyces antarcticus]
MSGRLRRSHRARYCAGLPHDRETLGRRIRLQMHPRAAFKPVPENSTKRPKPKPKSKPKPNLTGAEGLRARTPGHRDSKAAGWLYAARPRDCQPPGNSNSTQRDCLGASTSRSTPAAPRQDGSTRPCRTAPEACNSVKDQDERAPKPPDYKQHKMGAEDYSPPSTDIITLTRHVLTEGFKRREESAASGDLTILLSSLQTTCKFIESNVRKASLINLIGAAGNTNVQGEDQKKLDVLSNEIMINALRASGKTAVLVSEEDDEAIFVGEKEEGGTFESTKGKYCVVFDPLDGSSNIDAGVNIGTIFGIYLVKDGSKGTLEDVLRPGREMVAAGYCMYGSSANLVLTTGNGVNGYTLDNQIGEFILTHPNIRLPNRGKIYSINEGNSMYYHEPVLKYLDSIKFPKGEGAKPYSARYIGSMVADVHRTLLYGGIFGYPDDKKSKSGKLRMLYEAFPMALLTEQAGGLATTGTERILDIQPTSIHQRCPVFLGSKEDVQDLEVTLDVRPARNTTGSSNRRPTGI